MSGWKRPENLDLSALLILPKALLKLQELKLKMMLNRAQKQAAPNPMFELPAGFVPKKRET